MASHYLDEIKRLREENEKLRNAIDMKSQRLEKRRQDNATLRRAVERHKAEIEALKGGKPTFRGKRVLVPMGAQS